jgi:hypothetical protein
MDATDTLPDDPALLKQLLIERESTIEQIKREAAEQVETLRQQLKEEAAAAIEVLKQKHQAEMEAVFRRFYGSTQPAAVHRLLIQRGRQRSARAHHVP